MPLLEGRSFRSRRSRKRQHKRHLLRTIVWIFVAGIMLVGIWYGTRYSGVTVADVMIEGGETVPHERVRVAAERVLAENYFFLIPKQFIYLYPEKEIQTAVRGVNRVAHAEVTRSGRIVHVRFDEYVPHALWCADATATTTENHCMLLDREGFAFGAAPPLLGGVLIRYFDTTLTPTIGTYVLDEGVVATLHEFSDAIATRHQMRVRSVTHTEDNDLIFTTDADGDLLIAGDANIQTVFENLESILNSEEFNDIDPNNLDYIDLRFGNKVYIKEESTSTPATTSPSAPQ